MSHRGSHQATRDWSHRENLAPAHQAGMPPGRDSRTGPKSARELRGIWASMVTLTGNDAVNSTVGLAIFKVFLFCFKRKKRPEFQDLFRCCEGDPTRAKHSEDSGAHSSCPEWGPGPCPAGGRKRTGRLQGRGGDQGPALRPRKDSACLTVCHPLPRLYGPPWWLRW